MGARNGNRPLNTARKAKFDEFYTQARYIEKELGQIDPGLFVGKTVYCNCDSEQSEFWRHFRRDFRRYGLKRLVATHWQENGTGAGIELREGWAEPRTFDHEGDGDFRSAPCLALLDEADIDVTNPPFSLFREFFSLLIEHGKRFMIIGNLNAVTYKDVFPCLAKGEAWLGRHRNEMRFHVPDSYEGVSAIGKDGRRWAGIRNICWFTNFAPMDRKPLELSGNRYDPAKYPRYGHFDAIEVARVRDIR